MKKTVVFDFDGVIHSYRSGWQGEAIIPDPPVDGIAEAIGNIRAAGYEVIVVSMRCAVPCGRIAVARWLDAHGIKVDGVQETKPPAIAYIDDRAICFDGNTQTLLQRIVNFVPWNHMEEKPETFAEMRARKGYTQSKLAADLGVKQSIIAMWEAGKSSPTVETCALIALIFRERVGAVAEAMCASHRTHMAVIHEIDKEAGYVEIE